MEEHQPQTPIRELPKESKNSIGVLLYVMLGLAFAAASAYAVYVWQRSESEHEKSNLQSEIDLLKKANEPKTERAELLSYESKVGGLTLLLPSPYVVIVNVDGNKGGAPGSTLRIGKESSEGIIQDNVYEWVEIEISHTNASLEQGVQLVSTRLKGTGFEDINVVDAKVRGHPAKLITAQGLSYDANRRIYVVKSGEFEYQIISKTQDSSKDDEMLRAVLDGISIEEAKLDS